MSESIVCEIINPSDALTMRCATFKVGAVAVMLLGGGKLGLDGPEEDHRTPVLFGWSEWISEQFGSTNGLAEFKHEHRGAIAEALRSVALGTIAERADYEDALAAIPEEGRAAFIKRRNDRRRSSMNDIEGSAHRLADALEGGDS